MGASGFTIFRKVTFPHIKWALLVRSGTLYGKSDG